MPEPPSPKKKLNIKKCAYRETERKRYSFIIRLYHHSVNNKSSRNIHIPKKKSRGRDINNKIGMMNIN